jgi:predicted ArsR family transcriptional regulator
MVRRLPVSFATAPVGSVAERVLAALRAHPAPATLAELSGQLQVHANTVRHAVQSLITAGLVARAVSAPQGRGRPAHAFVATAEAQLARPHGPELDDHNGLTAALVAHLSESADPPAQARLIGRRWGRHVVDDSSAGVVRPAEEAGHNTLAGQAIVDMLERLGFSPTIDEDAIALRTCPLLDLARGKPGVVCAIHAGLIDGARERLGHEGAAAELEPFAEAGACRLRLTE